MAVVRLMARCVRSGWLDAAVQVADGSRRARSSARSRPSRSHVLADGGVGADVGVDQRRRRRSSRAAHGRALQARPARSPRAPRRGSRSARPRSAPRCRRGSGGWPRACPAPGRCPSTSRARCAGPRAGPESTRCWIASVISSSPRPEGSIARAASKIGGREHVDADEREVGLRLLRLLHQARHAVVAVELGHAVVLGVADRREQDQRVGLLAAERLDQRGHAVAQQVVAEVHDERRVAEERPRP